MKILFLSFFPPLPPDNGIKMRLLALLRALAAEGSSITLLTFDGRQSGGGCEISKDICWRPETVQGNHASLSQSADYAGRLKNLLLSEPYSAARYRSAAMRNRVEHLLRENKFDTVFCEEPYPAVNLPLALPIPLVIDCQNVEHLVLERYLEVERNPLRRAYAKVEARKLRQWERDVLSSARMVFACSTVDRDKISSLCPGLPVAVAPNAIDTDSYRPALDGENTTLVYTGGMDWLPNRDAVEFFASRILPAIRRRLPDVRLIVGGRRPPEQFRLRFSGIPCIEFTGTVPDLRATIARAAVCIVPLRIGSGTRLKILEAAAMAKPVVSTRLGAEGLDFRDGEEILIADEPDAFAKAIIELISEPQRRMAMGRAARARVERQYSLAALRLAVREGLGMLNNRRREAI